MSKKCYYCDKNERGVIVAGIWRQSLYDVCWMHRLRYCLPHYIRKKLTMIVSRLTPNPIRRDMAAMILAGLVSLGISICGLLVGNLGVAIIFLGLFLASLVGAIGFSYLMKQRIKAKLREGDNHG